MRPRTPGTLVMNEPDGTMVELFVFLTAPYPDADPVSRSRLALFMTTPGSGHDPVTELAACEPGDTVLWKPGATPWRKW